MSTSHLAKQQGNHSSTQVLWWGHVTTPLGDVYALQTEHGLKRVSLGATAAEFLHEVQAEHSPDKLRPVFTQLETYFSGEPITFSVDLDLSERTPFQREVMHYVYGIPFGETMTYGDIAKEVGRPKAARAVGSVMSSNPIAIIVPCHRVVGASGGLGGYSSKGGLDDKRYLLRLEGINV